MDNAGAGAAGLSFPFAREHPLEPPSAYRWLRDRRPAAEVVLEDGAGAFVVTRYADVREVLTSARFSREALSRAGDGELVAGTARPAAGDAEGEGEGHSTPYRLVLGALSPRAVARLRPYTEQVAGRLVEAMAGSGPSADLIEGLALPLPAAVMGKVLGIPPADRAWFQRLSSSTVVFRATEESRGAVGELRGYVSGLLAEKRGAPADDLCSSLVAAHDRSAGQVPWESVVTLVLRVAAAGLHSVVASLGKGVPLLLRHPQVYAALGSRDQGDLAAQVVEELLRLTSPAPVALPRQALEDVELAGALIPRGSVVLACLESANYDEGRYERPGLLVPERGNGQHASFGMGANYCVGAALARMELQSALTVIASRLPGLALGVPDAQLRLRPGGIAPDVMRLPVTW